MRIRYLKPVPTERLNALGFPSDPTDVQGIDTLSTQALQQLLNQAYEQLDADYAPLDAADWYAALASALDRRLPAPEGLARPA